MPCSPRRRTRPLPGRKEAPSEPQPRQRLHRRRRELSESSSPSHTASKAWPLRLPIRPAPLWPENSRRVSDGASCQAGSELGLDGPGRVTTSSRWHQL